MKKLILSLVGIIFLIFLAAYVVLFTGFGNNIVASIAQKKIKESANLDLNISKFELSFSKLNLNANLQNMLEVQVSGDISPLKLGFMLDYEVLLNKNYAKELNLNLNENIKFSGKINGVASDFSVSGAGVLLGSNTSLEARIYEYSPIALSLNSPKIEVEQILALLGQKAYAKGNINILADIKAQDLKPDGNAIIKLDTNSINYALIQKDFGVTLPQKSNINGQIAANFKDNKAYIVSLLQNDYAKLSSQNTTYDLANNALNADLKFVIEDLRKLESITKTKLFGKLDLNANLLYKNNAIESLQANINGLGKEFSANIKNNELSVLMNEISLEKLLAFVGYAGVINGNLNANLNAKKLDFSEFEAKASVSEALINAAQLKKLTSLDLPSSKISLAANAKAKNQIINYDALLSSNLLNINKLNGSYNMQNSELKINADANVASGKILANSDGKKLNLDITKLDIAKLLALLGQEIYANGELNAKANLNNLDFKNLNGDVVLNAKGALNKKAFEKDFKNFPNDANFALNANSNINKSITNFKANLNSTLANLSNFEGSFDINKIILNSKYNLELNDFSKLSFLANRNLKGSAKFNGDLGFNKTLSFNAASNDIFKGKLNASLKNNQFIALLSKINLSNLAQGLDFMDIYDGFGDVKINYNLLSESGDVSLDMSDGKLKKTALTNALMLLTQKDITDDVYSKAVANAKIVKKMIDFNVQMLAKRSEISIDKAKANLATNAINVPFRALIDRAEFSGVVGGSLDSPKINLDAKSVVNTLKNIVGGGKNEKNEQKPNINNLLKKIF